MKSFVNRLFARSLRGFLAVSIVLSISACGDIEPSPSSALDTTSVPPALTSHPRRPLAKQSGGDGDSLVFNPKEKLLANGGTAGDEFGSAIAISGDFAFVAAASDDINGIYSGSVAVYQRNGGVYTQIQQLTPSDAAADDLFGLNLAASGDTLIVGANGHSTQFSYSGAAYVFVRNGGIWIEQAKLIASDEKADAAFGWKVDVSEDTAVVGAPLDDANGFHSGAAYVFARNGGIWTEQQKLVASDGAIDDEFGDSLDIDGPITFISAPYDDDIATNSGSVYFFQRYNGTFLAAGKLQATDAQADDHFGHGGVALDAFYEGDNLYDLSAAIGAPEVDVGPNADQGAIYVFGFVGAFLQETQKLVASNGKALDNLGLRITLEGPTLIAGVPDSDVGSNVDQGAVYVFARNMLGPFAEQQKIVAADSTANDHFGFSVALYGDSLVAGAIHDDDLGSNAGSAYVFIAPGAGCSNNAQCSTGFCVDEVCCDSACGGKNYIDCLACSTSRGAAVNGTCSIVAAGIFCGNWPMQVCDAPEWCDGVSPTCPEDRLQPAGVVCNLAASDCDIDDHCNGTSPYCVFAVAPVGTKCRDKAGPCDIPETCNGVFAYCPFDEKLEGTVCRPSADLCDVAETCDGVHNDCPTDAFVPQNVLCRDALGICDVADRCSGSSAECPNTLAPDGTQCRPAVDNCDATEVCNGMDPDCPLDGKQLADFPCRMSAGPCDITEMCDGVSDACPADQKTPAGTECRSAAGICDATEACDGSSNTCPPDVKVVFGTSCRESVAACDVAEQCNGSANDCPADENTPNGTPCAGGICSNGACSMETTGAGGNGGGTDEPGQEAGCSCSIPGAANNGDNWGVFAMFCVSFMRACRRRSPSMAS